MGGQALHGVESPSIPRYWAALALRQNKQARIIVFRNMKLLLVFLLITSFVIVYLIKPFFIVYLITSFEIAYFHHFICDCIIDYIVRDCIYDYISCGCLLLNSNWMICYCIFDLINLWLHISIYDSWLYILFNH